MMHSVLTIVNNILNSPAKSDYLYLDPGSGSILIQLLIASALGAALILKTSWSRIKKFFRRDNSNTTEEEFIEQDDE